MTAADHHDGPGPPVVATVHRSSVLRAPDDRRAEARRALPADLEVVAGVLDGGH